MERIFALQGGRNFRDLGGYPTHDGRRVRWRRVFRSGVMAYLTDRDQECLSALAIRTCCDFRDVHERSAEPVNWRGREVTYIAWDYINSTSLQDYSEVEQLAASEAQELMMEVYRRLPYQLRNQYAGLFRALAAGEVPLIFNCAAGKDRTGVAAALLLWSLGVPRDHIIEDYALTDSAVDLEQCLFANPERSLGFGKEFELMIRLGREGRAPLIKCDPIYLHAMFEEIQGNEGSIESYLDKRLGIDHETLTSIRSHLLEN